jgi:hypothetical protein
MKTRRLTLLLACLLCALALVGSVLAMSSDNYRLDWFTPLTGGGGAADSTNYAIDLTVGQTAVGTSNSACLGYWCGITAAAEQHKIYLPLTLRNSS